MTKTPEMAELERLMRGYQLECNECEQIAGKALGYPWYKDDQKNCPGATEADGVCVGEHVPSSVVAELARRYTEANSVSPDAKATALEMAREICINILGAGDPSQTLVVNGDIHITDEGIFAVAAYLESASPPEPDALAVIEAARALDKYAPLQSVAGWYDPIVKLRDALATYDKAKRPTPAATLKETNMHKAMLREVIKVCRQRQAEGDCPTTTGFPAETLEDAVIQLAAWNDSLGEQLMDSHPKRAPAVAADMEALVEKAEDWKRRAGEQRTRHYERGLVDRLIASLRKGAGT